MLSHPFEPIWDENSRILILGTFPSELSRQTGFYYGHPRNRFWKVLSAVYGEAVPESISQKKSLLYKRQIALWDVLESCEITASSDSSIKNAVPNNIDALLAKTDIQLVLLNGRKAYSLYTRFVKSALPARCLPSTSPANAAWTLDKLIDVWGRELV